jgi:hypothetical protein
MAKFCTLLLETHKYVVLRIKSCETLYFKSAVFNSLQQNIVRLSASLVIDLEVGTLNLIYPYRQYKLGFLDKTRALGVQVILLPNEHCFA